MELTVNGISKRIESDPDQPLLWVLRDELELTGAKYGCGEGQCGACTVLVNGEPRRSCQVRSGSVAGQSITTIEGIADGDRLHPIQQAFLSCDAMQCGYCTAGMIVASIALVRRNASPSRAQIKEALEGHVCRCGTYNRILAAVEKGSRTMSAEGGHRRA